jgi:hypothetical protein
MISGHYIPTNLQEEKRKFFFDIGYNPHFHYSSHIGSEELDAYGQFDTTLLAQAKYILDTVIGKWGKESAFLEEKEGRVLTRDETNIAITAYLKENKLTNKVSVKYSSAYIARTAVVGYTLHVRLPIEYREHSFRGVLDHEIGTHMYRRLNEERQPWNKKRSEYGLGSYIETEEGIASLNACLSSNTPYLWVGALRYYACAMASKMSFAQLYEELKKYIDDKDRRFNTCLRAKRGLQDTSLPGGYTKDKVYLEGLIKVFRWLSQHDFDLEKLYIGKVSIEDLSKAWSLNPGYEPIVPAFYTQDKNAYKKKILEVMKLNKLS